MIVQAVVSVLLVLIVLLQEKNSWLNLTSMWGWMWEVKKRWPEKVIHNLTVFMGTLFIINALAVYILS